MKRWAFITVGLYGLILLLLTIPVTMVCGLKWSFSGKQNLHFAVSVSEAAGFYVQWGYWLWFAVLLLCQALLLFVPLQVAQRKLQPRRHLLVPLCTASFLWANLFLAGVFAIIFALYLDKGFGPLEFVGETIRDGPVWRGFVNQSGLRNTEELLGTLTLLSTVGVLWLCWAYIFYRFSKRDDPNSFMKRGVRWLLRGSILELLVAIPSHILVRGRDACCAPAGTFWGIATGLSVMLLAFGPGVFFLFAERARRLHPASKPEEPAVSETLQTH